MIAHFTHNDLDALGCMLNLHAAHPNTHIHTFHTNYRNIVDVVEECINFCQKYTPEFLLISDVSFSQERILLQEILNKVSCDVIYLDHHVYPDNFFDGLNMTYVHDVERSATQITHDYFNVNHPTVNAITKIIDVYDLWQRKHVLFEKAIELNEYFWTVDRTWMYDTMINNDYKLPGDYMSSVNVNNQLANDAITKYYEKNLIHTNGETTIVFADEYFNKILLQEFNKGIKFVIIANSYGIIRIRFNQYSDISKDTKEAMKQAIIGDSNTGHLNAFTFKLEQNSFANLMDEIKRISNIFANSSFN